LPESVSIGASARFPAGGRKAGLPALSRYALTVALFAFAFAVLGLRLVSLGLDRGHSAAAGGGTRLSTALSRPDIVDRKGRILATDIVTGSLYANPQKIVDLDDTVEQLAATLPELEARTLRRKLSGDGQFRWIARKLSPRRQAAVHELGLPGLGFAPEPHRVYPAGAEAAHILGHVDVDNKGLAGIETWIDRAGDRLDAVDAALEEGRNGDACRAFVDSAEALSQARDAVDDADTVPEGAVDRVADLTSTLESTNEDCLSETDAACERALHADDPAVEIDAW
jgi:hypothetical protein